MKTEFRKAYEAGRCGYDFNKWYNNYQKAKVDISFLVLEYLFQAKKTFLTGAKPFTLTPSRKRLIRKRVQDGHNMAQFKGVIDFKISDWKHTEWQKHLVPETLFSDKFDMYLDQARDAYANKKVNPYKKNDITIRNPNN